MNSNKKQNQNQRSNTFFEAFRELGKQTVKTAKDAATDIAVDSISQLTGSSFGENQAGEIMPGQSFNLEQMLEAREKQAQNRERRHFEQTRQQENLVFSRKEEQIKAQIVSIQDELKKLITEAAEFASEIETAVDQAIVNPGVYHLNFFDKLRQIIILLRKKLHDSKTWMHQTNMRARRKKGYWGMVQKSGTKFMLSQERTLATQAG